jgi:hypothetical protein
MLLFCKGQLTAFLPATFWIAFGNVGPDCCTVTEGASLAAGAALPHLPQLSSNSGGGGGGGCYNQTIQLFQNLSHDYFI